MTDWNTGAETPSDEVYGHTERQLAFKLLAAHAMVDPEFYARLRDDPAAAANELHIALTEDDLRYLREVVEWPVLDKHAEEILNALHIDAVVGSIW
jgi:hypothetical protein